MLRFSNTKSSMLFNLMPVGEAPGLVLDVYKKKNHSIYQDVCERKWEAGLITTTRRGQTCFFTIFRPPFASSELSNFDAFYLSN